ncbi:Rha family transcriptional regulator [Escherichia coli]
MLQFYKRKPYARHIFSTPFVNRWNINKARNKGINPPAPKLPTPSIINDDENIYQRSGKRDVISSRLIASSLGMEHTHLARTIKNNADAMKELGPLLHVKFVAPVVNEKLMESDSINPGGAPLKHFLLNYDQVMLLLSIVEGVDRAKTMALRIRVIRGAKEIYRRDAVRSMQLATHDKIRELICDAPDFQKEHLFMIAAMENKHAGIARGTDRGLLSNDQITALIAVQQIIFMQIRNALASGAGVSDGIHAARLILDQLRALPSLG